MPGKEQSMRGSLFKALGLSGFVSMTRSGCTSLLRQRHSPAISDVALHGGFRLSWRYRV
jgi:hypothetical protein